MKKTAKKLSFLLSLALLLTLLPTTALAASGLDNFEPVNQYTQGQFADVASASWFAGNVQSAYELGLMKGSSENAFNPNGNLTVAESLALACRIHDIYNGGKGEFTQGAPWYQVYVDYALETGIISAGQFSNYTLPATRAQFVTILGRALPDDATAKINEVEDRSIPDVDAGAAYSDVAYRFYRAGILTGDAESHKLNPNANIKRSEVAAIATRVADPKLRVSVTMEYTPAMTAVTGLTVSAGAKDATLSWTAVPDAAGYNVYVSTNQNSGYSLSTTAKTNTAKVSNLSPSTTYYFKVAAYAASKSGQNVEGPQSQPVSAKTVTAPISYSGSGSKVISGVSIPAGQYYAECTFQGTGNFIVKLHYGSASYESYLLANEIGSAAERYCFDRGGKAITNGTLEIEKGEGDWTIEFKPVSGTTTTNIQGSGTVITGVFTAPGQSTVTMRHSNGSSNFIVKAIKMNGESYQTQLLANEIGSWSGQKVAKLDAGAQYFLYIQADGDWSVDFGRGDAVTRYSGLTAPDKVDQPAVPENPGDDDPEPSNPSNPDDGSSSGGDSGDSDLWGYQDAKALDRSIELFNKGMESIASGLDKSTGLPSADVVIAKTSIQSVDRAARYLQEAMDLMDQKTELKLTDGSTLRDYVQETYDLLMEMKETEPTEENIRQLRLDLKMDAAVLKVRGSQIRVLTTRLVNATLGQ
ncbi:MAG: hypothetical protein HFF17_12280 [Oscillospiraceae bacterium]|nr:hypothetical protein [Oscillospiraceae bacterium]